MTKEDVLCGNAVREDRCVQGIFLPNLSLLVVRNVGSTVEGSQGLRSNRSKNLVGSRSPDDVLCAPASASVVSDHAHGRELFDETALHAVIAPKVRCLSRVLSVVVSDDVVDSLGILALDESSHNATVVCQTFVERPDGAGCLSAVDNGQPTQCHDVYIRVVAPVV